MSVPEPSRPQWDARLVAWMARPAKGKRMSPRGFAVYGMVWVVIAIVNAIVNGSFGLWLAAGGITCATAIAILRDRHRDPQK
jgi:membrane associated rhomboid family serine protease